MSTGNDPAARPSEAVLDASVVLATLQNEPGAEVIDAATRSFIVTVNLAEVMSTLVARGVPVKSVRSAVLSLGIQSVAFDDERAFLSSLPRAAHRHGGMSLGDRTCLALAITRNLPALVSEHQPSRSGHLTVRRFRPEIDRHDNDRPPGTHPHRR